MKTNILIIGAGPYGISLFYELQLQKLDTIIIGDPFSLWMKHMIPTLNLRSNILTSEIFSSNHALSWKNYLAATNLKIKLAKSTRIPVNFFQEYAKWVITQLPEKIINDKVAHLTYNHNQFVATTQQGMKIEANKVVIATGIGEHRYLPEILHPFKENTFHSYETAKFQQKKNAKILVLGGGQSAADTIIALSPYNKITWVHRHPIIYYHEPLNIPEFLFSIIHRLSPAFYYFPKTLHRLLGKKFISPTIDPIVKDKMNYENINEERLSIADLNLQKKHHSIHSITLNQTFDYIIACTGYRFKLSSFNFLDQVLKNKITVNCKDIPILNWNFQSNIPGLFMIGGIAETTHGPAVRFMMGCRQATLNVTRALK